METKTGAFEQQIGGEHYKGDGIQPLEFIMSNNMTFPEGSIIKYIYRHKKKNGAEDIKKAIHYCQLILEMEYGTDKS